MCWWNGGTDVKRIWLLSGFGPVAPPLPGAGTVVVKYSKAKALLVICIFLAIAVSCGNYTTDVTMPNNEIALTSYRDTIDEALLDTVEIGVSEAGLKVVRFSFLVVPADLYPIFHEAVARAGESVITTDEKGLFHIELVGDVYNQSNVLVFLKEDAVAYRLVGYIELLRQSGDKLKELYSVNIPHGYSIIGRHSGMLPNTNMVFQLESAARAKMIRSFPDLGAYRPGGKYDAEIAETVALMRFIWSKPIHTGLNAGDEPIDFWAEEYRSMDPLDRLDLAWAGDLHLQCGGVTDVFLDLAIASSSISLVRSVSIDEYVGPLISNDENGLNHGLTTSSHALAEIYLDAQGRWALVDPFGGCVYRNKESYVSAEQIQAMSDKEKTELYAEQYVDGRNGFLGGSAGSDTTVQMFGYYLSKGFFSLFNNVTYGPATSAFVNND